jgi:Na+/H+ antiporter NhaD/arsenite permease-like protein
MSAQFPDTKPAALPLFYRIFIPMQTAILVTFILGYIAIAFENTLNINKAATALVTGVLCWVLYIFSGSNAPDKINGQLLQQAGEISGILFFLLGAMTIVELIDAHNGFDIITRRITTTNKRKLLWIVGILAFLLSAILDNLTTTIVMIALVKKLVSSNNTRLFFAGIIIIAANAGGAFSPIGDVTTTMLWIGGQVTPFRIVARLFLPSLACLLLPLSVMNLYIKGKINRPGDRTNYTPNNKKEQKIVFVTGILCLVFVPVFKAVTHLPPFMGMLMALGLMWIITEIIHKEKNDMEKDALSVAYALQRIDTPSILFFLGILISIGALQATGQLNQLSGWLVSHLKTDTQLCTSIGLLSAVVDNVPLVAASQGMFSLQQYPTDHFFWELLAYSTGTGGSILIIGSAAGVAAMGIEKISFTWYLKRFSFLALLGYFGGIIMYILQHYLMDL